MDTPDVTVIVPVYNTGSYLARCLDSLRQQTIGFGRMQIVAVDDGSTDGSGRELDRFAARHPGAVTVVHTPNSGGPAAPCNRALEHATGRYLFYLGADDYLAPFALQRMVEAADEWESDVLLCRVVGVNSRFIHQEVFARTEPDLDMFESGLPLSLANTKLFRRELVERHRLRYPEDMTIGSDQPFTIEACYRARRISVLADDAYYFAVRRLNSRNVTILSKPRQRLADTRRIMEFVADLIPAGKQRDALLTRHFQLELATLLEDAFGRLDTDTRRAVFDGIAALARRFLTDEMHAALGIEARLRLGLARDGTLDELLAVIEYDAEHGTPPSEVVDGRRYAAYPGAVGRPEFDVTDAAADWLARLAVGELGWDRTGLVITAGTPARELADHRVVLTADDLTGVTVERAGDDDGTTVRVRFPVADLLRNAGSGVRRSVRVRVTAGCATGGTTGTAPVRTRVGSRPVIRRSGSRWYAIAALPGTSGHLMISVVPLTPRRVAARLLRRG
ncbi:MAG: glycosyltransferase [Micromonosporaceae bacterium]